MRLGREVAVHPVPELRGRELAEPQVRAEARRADRRLVAAVVLGEAIGCEALAPRAGHAVKAAACASDALGRPARTA